MLIKKENASEKKNSDQCTIWEYQFETNNLGLATGLIDGRYPKKGFAINEKCDEMIYVLSNKGIISCDNENFDVKEEDSVYVEKGKKFSIKGKSIFVAIITNPSWYPEQHKYVEK